MKVDDLLPVAKKVLPFAIFVPIALARSNGDPQSLAFFGLVIVIALAVAFVPRFLKRRGIGLGTSGQRDLSAQRRHVDDIMASRDPATIAPPTPGAQPSPPPPPDPRTRRRS